MVTLLLHNLRSTHNVGSIFRTADGFGIDQIICSGYTPYPLHANDTRLPHIAHKITAQIHKTALGAEMTVPWSYFPTLEEARAHLPPELPFYALEQHATAEQISSFYPAASYALLLGEEVEGISPEILATCDAILEIPMKGKKESFNVSVATAIALYALTTSG